MRASKSRPNQAARQQMPDLTPEFFANCVVTTRNKRRRGIRRGESKTNRTPAAPPSSCASESIVTTDVVESPHGDDDVVSSANDVSVDVDADDVDDDEENVDEPTEPEIEEEDTADATTGEVVEPVVNVDEHHGQERHENEQQPADSDERQFSRPQLGAIAAQNPVGFDRCANFPQSDSISQLLETLGLANNQRHVVVDHPQVPRMMPMQANPFQQQQQPPPQPSTQFTGNNNPFASANRKKTFEGGRAYSPMDMHGGGDDVHRRAPFGSGGLGGGGGGGIAGGDKFSHANGGGGGGGGNGSSSRRPQQSWKSDQIPPWWKTRAFSSATCFYPQNAKSKALSVPTRGNVTDLDKVAGAGYKQRVELAAKKERWARMKAKKKLLCRPVEVENFDDVDVEEEILAGKGVMLNHIIHQGATGPYTDSEVIRKYQHDVAFIKDVIMKETDGNIDAIRDLRFLIASVQTYGNIDGVCMMAEFAMNEFTLLSGIVERLHAVVGPWTVDNETQRRRATRHAMETHQIPLNENVATMAKRKLVEEILGRVEPSIAYRQGVKVGLYSDTCDESYRVRLHVKNSFKDTGMITDANERRFVLVLQNEYHLMCESMKHLAKHVGLQYEGFPTTSDRFVLVEAFVDAIADTLGESVNQEVFKWFGALGHKLDSSTPWEKNVDLHCGRHAEQKNSCCAQAVACRANFIVLHVLGTIFRRYHLRKFPATRSLPSPVMSLLPSLSGAVLDMTHTNVRV